VSIDKRTFRMWAVALAAALISLGVLTYFVAYELSLDPHLRNLSDVLEAESVAPRSQDRSTGPRSGAALARDIRFVLSRIYATTGAIVTLAGALLIMIAMWAFSRRIHPLVDHLQESETRYRSMIESLDEGVVVIDEHGEIRSVNPAVERLFGYRESELRGRNVKVLMPRSYAEKHDDYLKKYLKTGEKHIIGVGREVHGLRSDGTQFPMQLFVSEMAVGGRGFFTGIVHDISERKKVEAALEEARARAEQAAASKSQFLANMSHEIRTPMNGVLGMLELLSASELGPVEREYVHMGRQSAISLLALIDGILDLSKIEAGRIELEFELVQLHELIEDAAAIGASLAFDKDLRMNCYIASDVPARLPADPARLRQVLLNLLSNAIKFTDKGEVNLMVELEESFDDGVRLRFTVQDTGIGIEPENLKGLFDPFVQADISITRRFGGTGLGLTISRHLVELMDGEISVESEPGAGSVFSFTAILGPPFPSEPARIQPQLQSLRVLLVDNNNTAVRFLREYLMDLGAAAVDSAQDAREAQGLIEAALDQARPYTLVMIKHPTQGASSIVKTLRSHPDGEGTQVLALNPVNAPKSRVKRFQADDTLVRPVRRTDLERWLAGFTVPAREASPTAREAGREPGAERWKSARVLLAEDNPMNRSVCEKMLAHFGVEPEMVANGQQAFERLQQERFDLVLMDCQMPVMDGYSAARRIREEERGRNVGRTPIVAVTAHAMEGDQEQCMEAGMDGYISKPFRLAEIGELLERWLPPAQVNGRESRKT